MTVLAVAASAILFFMKQQNIPETFKCPLVPLTPLLGIYFNLFMISTFDKKTWLYFLLSLVPAFIIYFSYGIRHSKLAVSGDTDGYTNLDNIESEEIN